MDYVTDKFKKFLSINGELEGQIINLDFLLVEKYIKMSPDKNTLRNYGFVRIFNNVDYEGQETLRQEFSYEEESMAGVFHKMSYDLIRYGMDNLKKPMLSLEYLSYHVFRKYNIEKEEFTI